MSVSTADSGFGTARSSLASSNKSSIIRRSQKPDVNRGDKMKGALKRLFTFGRPKETEGVARPTSVLRVGHDMEYRTKEAAHALATQGSQWKTLGTAVKAAQHAAFRPGTHKNMHCQLRTSLFFCDEVNCKDFPTTTEVLSRYACFLTENFKSVQSVRNYISGVRTWSTILGIDTTDFYAPSVKLTLTGLEKTSTHLVNQRLPLWPWHLEAMFHHFDPHNNEDLSLWAMILLGYFAMLRKSQFISSTGNSFDHSKQLTRYDISLGVSGLTIRIKWTKISTVLQISELCAYNKNASFIMLPCACLLSYGERHTSQTF
ncbi:uncharacterized protein LOC124266707 isoform X1 [Haliotis rubra]|uniref:uncharacterized protein LOC124266707 isoform X1 n=1 Tax=Haliotis rubra TaxID=36100 RepID=UPI001EE5F074|nr:uncharacterized protein LOC124266707 isoform X1 [Haliotis rubra]